MKTGCNKSSWSADCPLYGGQDCPATCDRFEEPDADLREQLTIAIDGCYSTEGSACKLHPVFQPQKFLNLLPGILKAAGWHQCPKRELPLITPPFGLYSDNARAVWDQAVYAQRDADRKRCPAQQEGKP